MGFAREASEAYSIATLEFSRHYPSQPKACDLFKSTEPSMEAAN